MAPETRRFEKQLSFVRSSVVPCILVSLLLTPHDFLLVGCSWPPLSLTSYNFLPPLAPALQSQRLIIFIFNVMGSAAVELLLHSDG